MWTVLEVTVEWTPDGNGPLFLIQGFLPVFTKYGLIDKLGPACLTESQAHSYTAQKILEGITR